MNRTVKIAVVVLSLGVFSYAALGYVLGRTADDQKSYHSLTVYGEVLQRIQEDYVEEPNMPKVTAGALHGLLEALDPMSSYMSPNEFAQYKNQLAEHYTAGIGATISKRFGYVMIVSTLPDSPAEKAGLKTGDILEAIGGFATREMSVGQAMNLFAGQPGSVIKVSKIARGRTDTEEVDIVRTAAAPPHVTFTKISGDIGYLRIASLEKGKAAEIRAKLGELESQGIHKVVLDLRGCAAGDNDEGIAVARLFLSSGNIATLKGQTVSKQDFAADPGKVVWKGPVSVLTSNATSGAAELVAAGIAGNHRGDVVGERTFGSASEQKLIQLEDGSAVFLTVAYFYTPDGKSIPEDGVAPTTTVASTTDDADVFSHSENPPLIPGAPNDDPVLSKALDLLNGGHKIAQHKAPANRRLRTPWPVEA
ncbi:MAG: S41 family peptidase [Bryobacteraceae bacterium]